MTCLSLREGVKLQPFDWLMSMLFTIFCYFWHHQTVKIVSHILINADSIVSNYSTIWQQNGK